MIELRWLHKSVPRHDPFDGVQNLYPVKTLQYRLLKGFGEIVDGKAQGEWSDWIDVPEVHDES